MKTTVADANVVNAVSSSVRGAIHTDTLLAGLISSARVLKNLAVSASLSRRERRNWNRY
jgi:hypothetical protein